MKKYYLIKNMDNNKYLTPYADYYYSYGKTEYGRWSLNINDALKCKTELEIDMQLSDIKIEENEDFENINYIEIKTIYCK